MSPIAPRRTISNRKSRSARNPSFSHGTPVSPNRGFVRNAERSASGQVKAAVALKLFVEGYADDLMDEEKADDE
jgi:hypothetical protein